MIILNFILWKVQSPIIKDTAILENMIEFSDSRDDFDLDISFESYETMNKPNSDKYEFVYRTIL